MMFADVRAQLAAVLTRTIETGVSVQQNFPSVSDFGTGKLLGANLGSTSIALRNVPYGDVYRELERNEQYHIKLPDGGLLIFQYTFDAGESLLKHRLAFFPSPTLPTVEEAPELYEHDQLYGDILVQRIVRFPVRFDFDPVNYKPGFHPHSHLTLGQFDNCRIPVTRPVGPNTFLQFVLRNFYHLLYKRHMNVFEKKISPCAAVECITPIERGMLYVSV